MAELLGIEKLKKAVSLSISMSAELSHIKKINILTALGLLGELKELLDMVKNRKDVLAELKDLSPVERTELLEYIKEEFSIPNDKLESFIEYSLTWAESTITMIEMTKTL
jgi:DNA-directed RNA polymerase subunit F